MDEKIRSLFGKRMGLILDKRNNDAAIAAMRVRSEANKYGALHSSRTTLNVRSAYEEMYEDICRDAWSQLHHIAVTIGVKPDDALVEQLRDIFDDKMKPLADRYLSELQEGKWIIDNMRDSILVEAKASFSRSREIVGTEIELFSSNTAMMVSQSSSPTYIQNYSFSGPVGAFQQGDFSTATVTQNIDTEPRRVWRRPFCLSHAAMSDCSSMA